MSPISAPQLAANRQNATLSTGPRTETGKQRTRLNGLRHGLTGQTVVMPYEDRAAYEDFRLRTIASLEPANEAETALAQSIADESWRLNRARAIEENIFALGFATAPDSGDDSGDDPAVHQALTQAMTFLDHARELQLLTLYAGRIARSLARTKAELAALQAERRQKRAQAFEEALLLAQLAQSKGQTWNPANPSHKNGFGFSTPENSRELHRRERLAEAISLARLPRKAA